MSHNTTHSTHQTASVPSDKIQSHQTTLVLSANFNPIRQPQSHQTKFSSISQSQSHQTSSVLSNNPSPIRALQSDELQSVCVLSDPSSDPAEVQRVCEAVLGVKLPVGALSLKRKLQEMQDLASTLSNSSHVLKDAEPKLQEAQRLLQDAQKTRYFSLTQTNAPKHTKHSKIQYSQTHPYKLTQPNTSNTPNQTSLSQKRYLP